MPYLLLKRIILLFINGIPDAQLSKWLCVLQAQIFNFPFQHIQNQADALHTRL